jgi:hypothetical protein
MIPAQLHLIAAHLAEVEADPHDLPEHYYGGEFTEAHYPRPTLATIMACGEMRRAALVNARRAGATSADHRRVRSWFSGGTRAERRAREKAA